MVAEWKNDDDGEDTAVAAGAVAAAGTAVVLLLGAGFYFLTRPAASSLHEVKTYKDLGTEHASGPVTYKENPPVGGPHAPSPDWQNRGIYDQPVGSENAVHSLEYGAVWITYQPDLPPEQVEQLRALVRKQRDYVLLSPFPGIPSPIVISSWGNQLVGVTDAGDPRLPNFIATFKHHFHAPEVGAACTGGKGEPLP